MDHLAGRWGFPHAPMSSDLCWSHFFPHRHLFSRFPLSSFFVLSCPLCNFLSFTAYLCTFTLPFQTTFSSFFSCPRLPVLCTSLILLFLWFSSAFSSLPGHLKKSFHCSDGLINIFTAQAVYREVKARISSSFYIRHAIKIQVKSQSNLTETAESSAYYLCSGKHGATKSDLFAFL